MEILEKRSFVRVPFRSEAILKSCDKKLTRGSIRNLSLGGAFIVTPEDIERDADMEVEIFLDDPPSDLSVNLSAKVVRLLPEGVAIRFTELYLDIFEKLWDVISGNLADKDRVEEFLRFMNLNNPAKECSGN